jgi:hypothetical protein
MDDLTKKSAIVQELASSGMSSNQPITPAALYSVLDAKAVNSVSSRDPVASIEV